MLGNVLRCCYVQILFCSKREKRRGCLMSAPQYVGFVQNNILMLNLRMRSVRVHVHLCRMSHVQIHAQISGYLPAECQLRARSDGLPLEITSRALLLSQYCSDVPVYSHYCSPYGTPAFFSQLVHMIKSFTEPSLSNNVELAKRWLNICAKRLVPIPLRRLVDICPPNLHICAHMLTGQGLVLYLELGSIYHRAFTSDSFETSTVFEFGSCSSDECQMSKLKMCQDPVQSAHHCPHKKIKYLQE